MKSLQKLFLILLFNSWSFITVSATNKEEAIIRRDLIFTSLVEYDGFKSETHEVTTEDGYYLTLFRVRSHNCSSFAGSEPIIFMHGLFLSGDDCIIPGPRGSHCYEYANACRDVWVPNSRGTIYSRSHRKLNPDKDPEFWNFSFDEMALYDMPAVIDYVLEKTGKEQVAFIGHAQGATLLLTLCAAKPEYNDKVKVGFGLSMTGWLDHCRFIVIKIAGLLSTALTGAIEAGLNAEFLPRDGFYQPLVKHLCGTTDLSYPGCSALYFAVLGNNKFQIPPDTMKVLTGHVPGGTSLKNFNHWGQIYKNGFKRYDHGPIGNLKKYRRLNAPVYQLSKVTMKWIFVGSENDFVSDENDVDTLITKLPVKATKCMISNKSFGHLDYVYGRDVSKLITPMFLTYLDTGKFKCL